MGKNNGSSRFNFLEMERDDSGCFTGKKGQSKADALEVMDEHPLDVTPYMRDQFREPPLGTLTVRIFGEDIVLTGGPYRSKPSDMFGVKMAMEIAHEHDVSIPTRDFSVPTHFDMLAGLLGTVSAHFIFGDPIYVGCMGGKGRTGLFMATLAYLCGEDEPVKYVRQNYYAHAVETREQEQFVTSFDRTAFRRMLMKMLMQYNAVTWARLRKMPLQDKLLWLKLVFSRGDQ